MDRDAQSVRLLAVDDSPVYRKLIEQILRQQPYTLLIAKDGEEAWKLYRDHNPSIVVTDWVMPDLSGIELCQLIREHKSRSYTYVIMMTSESQKTKVVEALTAGADDYLTKPFDSGEMLARVAVGQRIVKLYGELQQKSRLLEQAALTDPLTGLVNRRALEDWAKKQVMEARRHNLPLWVGLCDIDSFKSVNDTYGHEAGDEVLRSFGELLANGFRGSDICGRLGGDEFAFLLSHLQGQDVESVLDRVRANLARLVFRSKGKTFGVTASFGITGATGSDLQEFDVLLRHADQLLYEAKHAGRNRVRVQAFSPACAIASGDY